MHAENQKLQAKTTTELLVSLQQNQKREAAKQKQESGKRPASTNAGPGPSSKRQQTCKETAEPTANEQPNHSTLQYTVQQLQAKNLKELTVRRPWPHRLSCTQQIESELRNNHGHLVLHGALVTVVLCRRLSKQREVQ